MSKVIVVGGGASGLIASIVAAKKGAEVIILERNDSLAKKILITGNGKCNYWNEDQDIKHYHSNNEEYLEEIITKGNQEKVMRFFNELGVIPKIKNGYYYPYSNQAVSIKAALLNEIKTLNIQVITNTYVEKIKKANKKFIIKTNKEFYMSDAVIISMGSKAAPKTGSDGNGYMISKELGHSIIPVLPSLTQLFGQKSYYKDWNGIRMEVKLSLYENGKFSKEERGEIHLTDYGISGICTFNLSGLVAKGLFLKKQEVIYINFLSDLNINDYETFIEFIDDRNKHLKNRNIDELFDGFINYKLVYLFLKLAKIDPSSKWHELSNDKKIKLAELFIKYPFEVAKTNDYNASQVCSGGIPLTEIDVKTMESLKVNNLYFTGEILDVDGDCGGYNLGFAWISGILAGESVGNND